MFQSTVIRTLASLKLTSAGLALLAIFVVASHADSPMDRQWISLPLGLLAVNLLAALLSDPRLQRSLPLALFHVALLAVLGLVAAGLLLEFEGRVELAEGQSFDWGGVQAVRRGAWYAAPSDSPALTQGPIDVQFEEGLVRQVTRSALLAPEAHGGRHVVSDDAPLRLDGYKIATSANKGFAVVLHWRDDGGQAQLGSLNMPSYPAMEWKQAQQWRTPSGELVQVTLSLPARPAQRWNLRALLPAASVQMQSGEERRALRIGDSMHLRGGTLTLVAVRLWMGYRIDRQPTLPAMLYCALAGISALGWHVFRRHFCNVRVAPKVDRSPARNVTEVHV